MLITSRAVSWVRPAGQRALSRHPGGPAWPGPAGSARRRTPAARAGENPSNSSAMASSRGSRACSASRGPVRGQLDQRGPAVGGMRAAHHELRVLQRIHHRGHVPRADPELDAEIAHDRRAAAVQRLEQPEPGVGEAAAGPPSIQRTNADGEARGLRDQRRRRSASGRSARDSRAAGRRQARPSPGRPPGSPALRAQPQPRSALVPDPPATRPAYLGCFVDTIITYGNISASNFHRA